MIVIVLIPDHCLSIYFSSTYFCILSSSEAHSAMSSAKRSLSSKSVCTLDLVCNFFRLKSFPSNGYLMGIPLSPSWKASVSMTENIMVKPCLTQFITGNGSDTSPSFGARASIPSWNFCTIAMNLAGHNFRKSITNAL